MFGILNIHKPAGWTSRDVVNRMQALVRPDKVGHAGTLDPLATGVLVVGIGPATRLIRYVQQMPKEYRATFLLGRTSPTEDIEGQTTELADPPRPTLADVRGQLPRFLGRIQQRPPAFSAIKVRGRRAYKLARQGKTVELAPRPVTIHTLQVLRYEYPELELQIACGSGTYVRALGRDLAAVLGTGAVMSALQRTAIGEYRVGDATPLQDLSPSNLRDHLLSPLTALGALPQRILTPNEIRTLQQGKTISSSASRGVPAHGQANEIAAVTANHQLVAILTVRGHGCLHPARNFPLPCPTDRHNRSPGH